MENQFDLFIQQTQLLATHIPEEWVEKLVSVLMTADTKNWSQLRSLMLNIVPKSNIQQDISEFVEFWRTEAPEIKPESLALALLAAIKIKEQYYQQHIELVWTGPTSQVIPMRRTDQALMQIIRDAKDRLFIVSFAVYRIRTIIDALVAAALRGVKISVLVESPEESEGRIAYNSIRSFGTEVRNQAEFYVWPKNRRPLTHDGRLGSLHAKIAVADGRSLFISSANLTQHALHLNMELGVLITGGVLPVQVEEHFASMIQSGVLRVVPDDRLIG